MAFALLSAPPPKLLVPSLPRMPFLPLSASVHSHSFFPHSSDDICPQILQDSPPLPMLTVPFSGTLSADAKGGKGEKRPLCSVLLLQFLTRPHISCDPEQVT